MTGAGWLLLGEGDADVVFLRALLQDLDLTLVADEHRRILECFEEYQECLSTTNPEYATPDRKAKIYAYCEAVGDEPKEKGRDYLNRSWWNLDAGELDPLRHFLMAL